MKQGDRFRTRAMLSAPPWLLTHVTPDLTDILHWPGDLLSDHSTTSDDQRQPEDVWLARDTKLMRGSIEGQVVKQENQHGMCCRRERRKKLRLLRDVERCVWFCYMMMSSKIGRELLLMMMKICWTKFKAVILTLVASENWNAFLQEE